MQPDSELPRRLEPEVMESEVEACDYDQMDHDVVNRQFALDFLRHFQPTDHTLLLDVGTGTAQIPIEICRECNWINILATDMSEAMLHVAVRNVERVGFSSRIICELANGRELPYADEHFSAVISNSLVHHLADPSPALREMTRVCQRHGILFVRDLVRPANQATLLGLVERYASSCNEHQRQLFTDSLHAALTLTEIRDLVEALGFPRHQVQLTSDRHWTWIAINSR